MDTNKIVPGRVYEFEAGLQQPPTSSLANAFFAKDGVLADAVVLRGYLGRSPILPRTRRYLERALDAVQTAAKQQAQDAKKPPEETHLMAPADAPYAPPEDDFVAKAKRDPAAASKEIKSIQTLLAALEKVVPTAEAHVPWRIYLTPALNRWVDFHLTSLLAWRQEPKAERKDTFTVWLRAFTDEGQPLPYRIVEETVLGPSFSTYLGGDLVDDFLGETSSSSGAWAGQVSGGGKPWSGVTCGGKPWSGVRCAG